VRARKADQVLEAARRVFLERGYDAATVERVAMEAGVSKATVYSNFHDKDALLAAMIEQVTAESEKILSAAMELLDVDGALEYRFTELGLSLARGVLRPEVIQMRRLAISTAVDMPEPAALYWQRGPGSTVRRLAERLTAMAAEDEITCPDPDATATLFAYALVAPLQDRQLLDGSYSPTESELDQHVRQAVLMLLRSLQPHR
jgi:TetR/AcrR family transcriptional repressor of mexJK operon